MSHKLNEVLFADFLVGESAVAWGFCEGSHYLLTWDPVLAQEVPVMLSCRWQPLIVFSMERRRGRKSDFSSLVSFFLRALILLGPHPHSLL